MKKWTRSPAVHAPSAAQSIAMRGFVVGGKLEIALAGIFLYPRKWVR
jgi:hypothetical protein